MVRQMVVIQTISRKEDFLNIYFEKLGNIQEIIQETFCPERQMKKRFRGQWNTVTEKLFPGYLFVDTMDSKGLYFRLKQIPMLSKMLGEHEMDYVTLSPDEDAFVRKIGRSRGDHTIGISTVSIEPDAPYKKGDRVRVVSGDLKDFEGEIVGYDLRKRKAMVKTNLFGSTVIHVGIELLENYSY